MTQAAVIYDHWAGARTFLASRVLTSIPGNPATPRYLMRFMSVPPVAVSLAFFAACASPTEQATSPLFSRRITFDEFNQSLATGAARLEIELQGAVAREVEIEEAENVGDDESVEAAAVRFEGLETSPACRGTIVLAPSFTIQFDGATTQFESDHQEDLTCAQFVERVQAALAAGGSPVVEAKRPAPADPQAPDAATFAAAKLQVENGNGGAQAKVDINVDAGNLRACSTLGSPPAGCVGVIQVLNVSIALDAGTKLETDIEHDDMDDADFEGVVTAVTREGTSCTLGSVTLADGTIVRVVAETELKEDDLCAVEAALAVAGTVVEADGKGLVTGDTPRTILASEVEFETEDADSAPSLQRLQERH